MLFPPPTPLQAHVAAPATRKQFFHQGNNFRPTPCSPLPRQTAGGFLGRSDRHFAHVRRHLVVEAFLLDLMRSQEARSCRWDGRCGSTATAPFRESGSVADNG